MKLIKMGVCRERERERCDVHWIIKMGQMVMYNWGNDVVFKLFLSRKKELFWGGGGGGEMKKKKKGKVYFFFSICQKLK